jgi:hypothetical protein
MSREDLYRRPMTYGELHSPSHGPANLADILERVLDKGIVIAGDIQINLLDIELLTIKLRLLVASVERAREMGINWWEGDSALTSHAHELREENRELRARLARLEEHAGLPPGDSVRRSSSSGGDSEGGPVAYAEASGEDAEVWTSVDEPGDAEGGSSSSSEEKSSRATGAKAKERGGDAKS